MSRKTGWQQTVDALNSASPDDLQRLKDAMGARTVNTIDQMLAELPSVSLPPGIARDDIASTLHRIRQNAGRNKA